MAATKTIRIRLREVLEERGLTIRAAGELAGVCYPSMLDLVHDRARRMDFDVLGRLCVALRKKPGDLLVLGTPRRDGEEYDFPEVRRGRA